MNAYETYRTYLALKRHFDNEKYDYFQYNGKVQTSEEAFRKRTDHKQLVSISREYDPFHYMVGNFVMSNDKISTHNMCKDHYIAFMALKKNLAYNFKQDLKKFRPNLVDNLNVDTTLSVPYIIELLTREEISLSTVAIFEGIFNCKSKWEKKDEFMLFENTSKKISKSWGFFDIPIDKYKRAVQTVFNL